MRALVVGGDGRIGRALCTALLRRDHDVVRTTRRGDSDPLLGEPISQSVVRLDMRDGELPWPPSTRGEGVVVYVLAAITGILRCEEDPDAWLVNAEAPAAIARQVQALRRHLVFVSSGAVERAQHTALARQKAYADAAVLAAGGCVVRPLGAVTDEVVGEFVDLLVQVGERRRSGLVRWEGKK